MNGHISCSLQYLYPHHPCTLYLEVYGNECLVPLVDAAAARVSQQQLHVLRLVHQTVGLETKLTTCGW